ncbi:hypothetical protein KL86DES1_10387 [uncultured Desulfovibrio sp.]|uniref:Uncharacterized protein n=1 Tax=uncultured Desulfovibrio sp. TaxID=167968 RepID=A0A212KYR9_9BACT|nr:hypothetical protein KL86DES1_10387 [uncultured Desulfovibrio sp.]VZH32260.1 conserved protein of unknown function [Desulfovibrio sp. 86]
MLGYFVLYIRAFSLNRSGDRMAGAGVKARTQCNRVATSMAWSGAATSEIADLMNAL